MLDWIIILFSSIKLFFNWKWKLNYEKEKGTINASGKNISTNKMILPLNKENIITIVNIFIDETLNNDTVTLLNELFKLEYDEILCFYQEFEKDLKKIK